MAAAAAGKGGDGDDDSNMGMGMGGGGYGGGTSGGDGGLIAKKVARQMAERKKLEGKVIDRRVFLLTDFLRMYSLSILCVPNMCCCHTFTDRGPAFFLVFLFVNEQLCADGVAVCHFC